MKKQRFYKAKERPSTLLLHKSQLNVKLEIHVYSDISQGINSNSKRSTSVYHTCYGCKDTILGPLIRSWMWIVDHGFIRFSLNTWLGILLLCSNNSQLLGL